MGRKKFEVDSKTLKLIRLGDAAIAYANFPTQGLINCIRVCKNYLRRNSGAGVNIVDRYEALLLMAPNAETVIVDPKKGQALLLSHHHHVPYKADTVHSCNSKSLHTLPNFISNIEEEGEFDDVFFRGSSSSLQQQRIPLEYEYIVPDRKLCFRATSIFFINNFFLFSSKCNYCRSTNLGSRQKKTKSPIFKTNRLRNSLCFTNFFNEKI